MSARSKSRSSKSPNLRALQSHTVYGKTPRQPSMSQKSSSRSVKGSTASLNRFSQKGSSLNSFSRATSTYSTKQKKGLRPTVVQRIDITLKRDKLGRLGFKMDPDTLIVHDVYDSLLTNAGVTPGTRLVTVDSKSVKNMKEYTQTCGDMTTMRLGFEDYDGWVNGNEITDDIGDFENKARSMLNREHAKHEFPDRSKSMVPTRKTRIEYQKGVGSTTHQVHGTKEVPVYGMTYEESNEVVDVPARTVNVSNHGFGIPTAWNTQPTWTMAQAKPTITTVGRPMVGNIGMVSPNWGVVGNMPAIVSGGNYGGVMVTQNTLQSMMTPFRYNRNHNMPFVIDVFARGCKLRWGARECALEIRIGNYHVCTDWAPASRMPRWDVYLGPFGVSAQMNERIIISILGRGQQHGAKILDMIDIPVRKLYNKGCYVKREFGMDRNNCKVQLEISMKSAGMTGQMGGGNMMSGGVVMPMGHLMTGGGFGQIGNNIVWA